jgi:hypothetical protein
MPVQSAGRPFNTETPLGRIMWDRGFRVFEVAHATGINARTLTEYLAGRKPLKGSHLSLVADFLDVHPEDLGDRG